MVDLASGLEWYAPLRYISNLDFRTVKAQLNDSSSPFYGYSIATKQQFVELMDHALQGRPQTGNWGNGFFSKFGYTYSELPIYYVFGMLSDPDQGVDVHITFSFSSDKGQAYGGDYRTDRFAFEPSFRVTDPDSFYCTLWCATFLNRPIRSQTMATIPEVDATSLALAGLIPLVLCFRSRIRQRLHLQAHVAQTAPPAVQHLAVAARGKPW